MLLAGQVSSLNKTLHSLKSKQDAPSADRANRNQLGALEYRCSSPELVASGSIGGVCGVPVDHSEDISPFCSSLELLETPYTCEQVTYLYNLEPTIVDALCRARTHGTRLSFE